MDQPRLAVVPQAPHTTTTCGQSCRRGLVTSHGERRSKHFGRVAVAYVQGSPKGGGALGSLGVTSTRLAPVPPRNREALMRQIAVLIFSVPMIAAISAAPAAAQTRSVDDQFCNRGNITSSASQLTRDWGERYDQQLVEQAAKKGWSSRGTVVRANSSEVICRITFSSVTSTLPSRRIELRDLEFRYSVSDGQLEAITLPLSGFDHRTSYAAIWERLFVDDRSFRSMMEEKAEHEPAMGAAVAEIIGRPKGSENAKWEPDAFCPAISAATAAASIIHWAEETNQVRSTGLTDKETPTWLPATGWRIGNFKVVSSIPFQSVICSADVAYTGNTFDGKHIPMEIRGMPYKVWGNDDGSELYAEVHDWPTEAQQKDNNDAFNRAWVVNGQTFEQAWAQKRQKAGAAGGPQNVLEALGQKQSAYNEEVDAYARSQGIDVDAIKRAEEEETRKYAEPCRKSGGTWGRPIDKYGNPGRLGCYHPTGER